MWVDSATEGLRKASKARIEPKANGAAAGGGGPAKATASAKANEDHQPMQSSYI